MHKAHLVLLHPSVQFDIYISVNRQVLLCQFYTHQNTKLQNTTDLFGKCKIPKAWYGLLAHR